MALNIEVKRDILFAPTKHVTHWALNPTYTSARGEGMIMTVTETDGLGLGANRYMEWEQTSQRFRSRDGGATWKPSGNPTLHWMTALRKKVHVGYGGMWAYWLEPRSERLIAFRSRPLFSEDFAKTWSRFYYEVSDNEGVDWDFRRPIIHEGGGCDEEHWMPDFDPDHHAAQFDQPHAITLDDGTLLFGFTVRTPRYVTRFFRGRWVECEERMVWKASEGITVPESVSSTGPCEPDLLSLGGGRVFATMRTQGIPAKKVPTTRQCALSTDGGRTWSVPKPLKYDDGTPVWVPAAISAFEREPGSGRVFWFGNIQPGPVCGQIPRYPLTMAEFDPKRLFILKDSVTVIQDLPPGAPKAGDPRKGELGRRYSNFGHYVDRRTGEFVLLVAEEPRVTWDDYWSDCIRFRIKLKP
ncbi:MAG: glycoside hydrolase [Verrucomicrobiae bacterium]|nr:glycoside hydrolase [Verrucomicrobiae bacterium]